MSGIIACISFNDEDVYPSLIQGMYGLQHRGQDSVGLGYYQEGKSEIFHYDGVIGDHNYPIVETTAGLGFINYAFTAEKKSQEPLPKMEKNMLVAFDGKRLSETAAAYAHVSMNEYKLMCTRDPHGIKPLIVGKVDDIWIVSSESCVIDSMGGTIIRDVKPGETITITKEGMHCSDAPYGSQHLCLFELVYIARPDSRIDGISVYGARVKMGHYLYEENPTKADIVVGSPDSGMIAALGYSQASGIPYQKALVKNRYIARTFINNNDAERKQSIKIKLSVVKELVCGKSVILVDDSIVRGTTIKRVVNLLKEAGAKEVHIRVSSPPVIFTDNVSIDIPSKEQLLCYGKDIETIRQEIGCDSLYFLSLEGLKNACGDQDFYTQYFNGKSPFEGENNNVTNI